MPSIDLDGYTKFLVDTATRKGMSGSTVFLFRHNNKYLSEKTFIGIYSGRIAGSDPNEYTKAQLGIVWKRHLIDEIVDGRTYGDISFQEEILKSER